LLGLEFLETKEKPLMSKINAINPLGVSTFRYNRSYATQL